MQPETPPDAGGGPGAAPELPEVVPDGVQSLLDGIFSRLGAAAGGIGDFVSGIAADLGVGGNETAALAVDALMTLL